MAYDSKVTTCTLAVLNRRASIATVYVKAETRSYYSIAIPNTNLAFAMLCAYNDMVMTILAKKVIRFARKLGMVSAANPIHSGPCPWVCARDSFGSVVKMGS